MAARVKLVVAVILALIVVGGIVDFGVSAGKIHPGVTVQGVKVGGMTKEKAATVIKKKLTKKISDKEFILTTDSDDADSLSMTLTADDVGAYVDGDALAEKAYAVGRSGNIFFQRIGAWFGKFNITGSVKCKAKAFEALVSKVNESVGTNVKESKLVFSSGKAVAKKGHDGYLVKESQLVKDISKCLFGKSGSSFTVAMSKESMHITKKTAENVAAQVNEAISDGITISYNGQRWNVSSSELASILSQKVLEPGQGLVIKDAKTSVVDLAEDESPQYDVSAYTDSTSNWVLQPFVNQKKADAFLVELLGDKAAGDAQDAKFDLSSGKVKIVKSKTGHGPDRKTATVEMQNDLFGTGNSTDITLKKVVIQPNLSTAKAKSMGIKEKIGEYTISYAGSTSERINNIELLCKMIDGSIVAPGDVWSFNDTTGERTADKGFKEAAAIVNGKHEDQLGGGVCCVASTVYNAVCDAGLGIEQRTNHSFYISTYDDAGVGDATVSYPEPDFKWKNDMDNYVLMHVTADGSYVHVSMWGTDDGRTVTIERGKWKKGDKYKTVKEKDPDLAKGTTEVTQSGQDGRSIVIHYYVTAKNGDVLHDIKFKSVYSAQNKIISVGTKTSDSDSSADSESDSDADSSEDAE